MQAGATYSMPYPFVVFVQPHTFIIPPSTHLNALKCIATFLNDSQHIFNVSHEGVKLCQNMMENDFTLFNALAMIAN